MRFEDSEIYSQGQGGSKEVDCRLKTRLSGNDLSEERGVSDFTSIESSAKLSFTADQRLTLEDRETEEIGKEVTKSHLDPLTSQRQLCPSSINATATSQSKPHAMICKPSTDTNIALIVPALNDLLWLHLLQITLHLDSVDNVSEELSSLIWQREIFGVLDDLKNISPQLKECTLRFFILAYTTMKDICIRTPGSQRIWVESMRTLIASRLTYEDVGQDRSYWSSAARFWYNIAAEPNSTCGLHIRQSVTSYDHLKQVSEFARSLTARSTNSHYIRTSETKLLRPFLRWNDYTSFIAVFLRAHAMLFNKRSVGELKMLLSCFSSGNLLENYIQHVDTAFQIDGIYIATINIAALLEYGEIQNDTDHSDESSPCQIRWLFTEVMIVVLRTRDPNVFPFIYVTLIFLRSLATIEKLPRPIDDLVPWDDISLFMDEVVRGMTSRIPLYDEVLELLPEDSMMCEQSYCEWLWSGYRFDSGDKEELFRETKDMMRRRARRILWLWDTLLPMRLRE